MIKKLYRFKIIFLCLCAVSAVAAGIYGDSAATAYAPAEIVIGGKVIRTDATRVVLSGLNIENISMLKYLTDAKELYLSENNIQDITPLAGLTSLTDLNIWGNNIADITPLKNLINLEYLTIEENIVRDLSPLSGLSKLSRLYLNGNPINDLSPLKSLSLLTWLQLSSNVSEDNLAILKELSNLKNLYFIGTMLTQDRVDNLIRALPDCKIEIVPFVY